MVTGTTGRLLCVRRRKSARRCQMCLGGEFCGLCDAYIRLPPRPLPRPTPRPRQRLKRNNEKPVEPDDSTGFSGILAEPSSTKPFYQVISEMQQKDSGSIASVSGFRTLDMDSIIARDDAAELADFMGHSVCKGNLSDNGQSAIVRFRDHTCPLHTPPSPRDRTRPRMPSSA